MSNLNPLTNGSYWGPVESDSDIFLEHNFLASAFLMSMGFGMQFILYVVCFRILLKEERRRISYILMAYTTLLCCTNLILTVTTFVGIEETYVNYRNFPGGVIGYLGAASSLSFNVTSILSLVAGNILADLLLLWRCSVIWRATGTGSALSNYLIIIPCIVAAGSAAMGLAWGIASAKPNGFFTVIDGHFALAYFCLTLSLNIILTGMIIFRIWSHQAELRTTLGEEHAKYYTSIATMFVESAALYTVVSIPLLVTFAVDSSLNQIFIGVAPAAQLLASYSIIWRVAEGRAWSRETLTVSLIFAPASTTAGKQSTLGMSNLDVESGSLKAEQH